MILLMISFVLWLVQKAVELIIRYLLIKTRPGPVYIITGENGKISFKTIESSVDTTSLRAFLSAINTCVHIVLFWHLKIFGWAEASDYDQFYVMMQQITVTKAHICSWIGEKYFDWFMEKMFGRDINVKINNARACKWYKLFKQFNNGHFQYTSLKEESKKNVHAAKNYQLNQKHLFKNNKKFFKFFKR